MRIRVKQGESILADLSFIQEEEIAIGSGTDVAVESGDIVLVKDDLLDAVGAVQLSKKVMSRIKQNIFWAFAYNTALIPVAAGLLYPLYGITFRPELAGLAMAMSSVTVISLSLMLRLSWRMSLLEMGPGSMPL